MLAWNWASGAINESTRALTAEAKIVRSANLNRAVWVLRIVGAKGIEFLLSLPVLALFVVLALRGEDNDLRLSGFVLAVPLALLLQTAALTGIGLMLAPLTVLFKDLQRLVRICVRMLFYLTPVIYGVHNVPEHLRWVFALNPFAGIIDLYRAALFPEQFVGWGAVGTAAVISFALLALGMLTFRRLEGRVLKEL
jgi:ABC-2 type transport system permease protein